MISTDFSHWWPRLVLAMGVLLAAYSARAQPARQLPEKKTLPPAAAPATTAPLSAVKMEEALRLLLRADSVASQRQGATLGPESSGLIVDQTITKIGHDF